MPNTKPFLNVDTYQKGGRHYKSNACDGIQSTGRTCPRRLPSTLGPSTGIVVGVNFLKFH